MKSLLREKEKILVGKIIKINKLKIYNNIKYI